MGLGLTISQGIVRGFGGSITVRSEVGNGTSFEVYLPGLPALSEELARSVPPPARPHARRPHVLVVDDEPQLCELQKITLGASYHVETNCSALSVADAIERGASYDLILCDLMLPKFSGIEAHARLSCVRPDQAARMVFMTGGAFSDGAVRFLQGLPGEYLEKPFLPDEASACVERALQAWGLVET